MRTLKMKENVKIKCPLFQIKDFFYCKKFYILGIPVYKIKYKPNCSKHYLFGILILKDKTYKKIHLNLSDKNFHPFDIDNNILLQKLEDLKEFTYIPNPGNMGDMLIAASTLLFFDKNKLPYTMFHSAKKIETIVYGGGGIWTKNYEKDWIKFIPYFKKAKRILILPSSFYECDKFINELDERFVIFCREKQSYDYLTAANTKAEIILDHDMAFRLDSSIFQYKDFNINIYKKRLIYKLSSAMKTISSIGYFLREDCEKIQNYSSDLDLSSLNTGCETSTKEHIFFSAIIMLCAVDAMNVVVTDRLHVGIASVLMGKQTLLLDNSYKKVSNVYMNTLSNNKFARLIKTIPINITYEETEKNNLKELFIKILSDK